MHGERALAGGTRRLLGKATPCVGRDRELGTLRALLAETVEEGTAQAALVVAPPGVGKSRLAHEFLQELGARDEAVSIWIARGDTLRTGSPLEMLGQALRSACGIYEGEQPEMRREKLSARVAAWVAPGKQRRVTEFLGEIVGAPFPDLDSLPLRSARRDSPLMADQVRAAFLDFLGAACAKAPVLVLLEDLHWGDRPTVQLLDAALRTLEERPLFVLALARPEVRDVFPRLWEGRRLHELRLVELSRRAGERLARHVLGERADAEVIARIVRLSEGNAFYLEELIRWTAEGKGADMPETVVAMIESRLGALDDGARRLLRAASVFGEVFCKGETISTRKNNAEWFRIFSDFARHGWWPAGGRRGGCARAIEARLCGPGERGSSGAGFRNALRMRQELRRRRAGRRELPSSTAATPEGRAPESSAWCPVVARCDRRGASRSWSSHGKIVSRAARPALTARAPSIEAARLVSGVIERLIRLLSRSARRSTARCDRGDGAPGRSATHARGDRLKRGSAARRSREAAGATAATPSSSGAACGIDRAAGPADPYGAIRSRSHGCPPMGPRRVTLAPTRTRERRRAAPGA
ncbi:AAA family ATPase [Sorangium sp. So ce429]